MSRPWRGGYSREQLLDAVWGHDRAVTDRTVDVYILRLRREDRTRSDESFVHSGRCGGFGYSFNEHTVEARQLRLPAVVKPRGATGSGGRGIHAADRKERKLILSGHWVGRPLFLPHAMVSWPP